MFAVLIFNVKLALASVCSTPQNTFVGSALHPSRWRSESLKQRYMAHINSTRSRMLPSWTAACTTRNCKREAKVWGQAQYAFAKAAVRYQADPANYWFLYFEDDAILVDSCPHYCMPEPVTVQCQFVSLDCRGSNNIRPYTTIGHYRQSRSRYGYGTAGFWFTGAFAVRMLSIANDRAYPVDLVIFEHAQTWKDVCWLDCLSHRCVVGHNDDAKLRIW